ncbi:MAG: hypothetical protein WD355_02910 [Balneolaceae bacterium]
MAFTVIRRSGGGYIFIGWSTSNDGDLAGTSPEDYNFSDWAAEEQRPDSNQLWIRTYGGSSDDLGLSLAQAPESGYFIKGSTESTDGDFSEKNQAGRDLPTRPMQADSQASDVRY